MAQRFAICLAMVSLLFVAPRPAAATVTYTYVFDTVDAFEIDPNTYYFTLTGIPSGQTAPVTQTIFFISQQIAQRCERLALLAMSKPGKYQLHIGANTSNTGCKLVRRVP